MPAIAAGVFEFRKEYQRNRNLIAWGFMNPDNLLELVDILIGEDARTMHSIAKQAFGLSLNVAAAEELIRMKKAAARPQDLADIEALETLL